MFYSSIATSVFRPPRLLMLPVVLVASILLGLAATAGAGPLGVAYAAAARSPIQLVHGGHDDVHGSGIVNSIDSAARKISITHQPISQIGWPSMTMDFSVAPSIDLRSIRPGGHVDFAIERDAGGMYVIQSILPRNQVQ